MDNQPQDEQEDDEQDLPVVEDDLATSEEESTERGLRETQFGLLGLFGLMTFLGVYFAIERVHHGWFTLHALGAWVLVGGVVIPAACLLIWLLRVWYEGASVRDTLLAIITLAAIALGLRQFWG